MEQDKMPSSIIRRRLEKQEERRRRVQSSENRRARNYMQEAQDKIRKDYGQDWRQKLTQQQKPVIQKATNTQGKLMKRPRNINGKMYDIQQLKTNQSLRQQAGLSQQQVQTLKADDYFRNMLVKKINAIRNRLEKERKQSVTPMPRMPPPIFP